MHEDTGNGSNTIQESIASVAIPASTLKTLIVYAVTQNVHILSIDNN